MSTRTKFAALLVGVAVVATVIFLGKPSFEVDEATADDPNHTTSLALLTYTFDHDVGAEPAVVATFNSSDPLDITFVVTLFLTPPGASEIVLSGAETSRVDGAVGVTCAHQQAPLPSGGSVRANFQALDNLGVPRFTFQRTIAIP